MTVVAAPQGGLIERKLRRARLRYFLVEVLAGAAEVVLWSVGLAGASLAADYGFRLEPVGRLLLVVVYGALLAVVVLRWLLGPLLGAPDDEELALRVEARHPELASALISTVQLSRVGAEELGGVSAGLVEALKAYTAQRTRDLNFSAVVPLRRPLRLVAAALVAVVAAWGFVRGHEVVVRVWAERFLRPLSSTVRYPTRTQVEVRSGGGVVARGDDFEVVALARGEVPARGSLHLRARGGGWQEADLAPVEGESGRFAARLERLLETIEYYVELGDARSDTYTLRVVPRPRVTEVKARYQLPAYAGGESRESPTGDVDVLVGTYVEVTAATNKPVTEAILELEPAGGEAGGVSAVLKEPMSAGPDGRLRTRFRVSTDGTYRIRLRDRLGLTNRDPIVHLIRALRDRPPRVRIKGPGRNKDMTATAYLPIRFEVGDDFGITEVQLRYAAQKPVVTGLTTGPAAPPGTAGEPSELRYQSVTLAGPWPGRSVEREYVFRLEPLGLEEGDTVFYHLRAADNRDLDPEADDRNWSQSREYEIRIVSPRAKREELRRRQEEAMRQIQLIIDKQKGTKEAVEELLTPANR